MKTLKKYSIPLFILIIPLMPACDSAFDDGLVSVRYVVTSETGADYSVGVRGEDGEWLGGYMQDEWEYEFRVEEGSQLLFISTSDVSRGSIEAAIYIDGEMHRSYIHEESSSTAQLDLSTSAWGLDDNIKVFYFLQGAVLENTEISLLSGVERLVEVDSDFGFAQRISRELIVDPEFGASIRVSRPSMEEGYTCMWAEIFYQPLEDDELRPGENLLTLASLYQCDVAPIEVDIAATVPGY